MIALLRSFIKSIPTLFLAMFLSVAVWVSAVNADDPVVQRPLSRAVPIERVGLSTDLVILGEIPNQVTLTLSAPQSVWDGINLDRTSVRAWIDLEELEPGTHIVPVNAQTNLQPAKVVAKSPATVTVTLERFENKSMPVQLVRRGEPAVGYQAGDPTLSQNQITISGPASLVATVSEVRVTLDLTQANDSINRSLDVDALDVNERPVDGITVTPAQITVGQPITQRGGYRNVVVKVVQTGQVVNGYRLTNMSVFPPTVLVFSSNPALIERLPGFVETSPLDLTGVRDDMDYRLPLNLPNGVEVVGDQTVLVQVGVAAIEGSLTISSVPIDVVGLPEDLFARISPSTVDVIISGPVPILDRISERDVTIFLDLSEVEEGTYQLVPEVTLSIEELRLESILPSSIEVMIDLRSRITLTPTPTRTPEPTLTPTPTPGGG